MDTAPGDYDVTERGREGTCRKCGGEVKVTDSSVVRYHPHRLGGIFHERCRPEGDEWYAVDEGTPDAQPEA
jgi:hypothetical protein